MSCRETKSGSAATTEARLESGLTDAQTLSAYHALRAEAPADVPGPTPQQWQNYVTEREEAIRANETYSDARRRSLLRRWEIARQETPPDGRTWYAQRNIRDRAMRNANALTQRLDRAAADLGVDTAYLRTRYAHLQDSTPRNRRGATPEGYTDQLRTNANAADLPSDPASVMALHAIEREALRARADRALSGPQRIERSDIGSGLIAEAGYDRDGGRLELVFRGRGENANSRVYSYRGVPEDVWEQFQTGAGAATYNSMIRGRSEYQYPSAEEADLDSAARQCGECGQFASSTHACPPRIARLEAAAAAARAPRTPQTDEERFAEVMAARPEPRQASRIGMWPRSTRLNARSTRYDAPDHNDYYRVPRMTDLRAAAQAGPVQFQMTVSMPRRRAGQRYGTDWNEVSADMTVDRPGRGQYVVVPTNPRCSCEQWRTNGHCPHVDEAITNFRARFAPNMSEAATVRNQALTAAYQPLAEEQLRARLAAEEARLAAKRAAAQAAAEEALRVENERAAAATARYQAEFTPSSPQDTYSTNFAAFEDDVNAALARKAAGEHPVEYMRENATGGMCTAESGRKFGVELEFDLPITMTHAEKRAARAAIARDLHAAGLTRVDYQEHYHASRGRGYTENHQGGWSYEQDQTVEGEVVSPVMADTPETWDNIAKVCEIIKRHGGVATWKTGSHVHVSTPHTTTATATGLLKTAAKYEDVLHRVSTNLESGRHRPSRWCGPNRDVPAGGYTSVSQARARNNSHHVGVNLQSVEGGSSDHAELRQWDGTLDPAAIQAQIKISAAMVLAAQRGAANDIPPGTRVSPGHHLAAQTALLAGSRRNLTVDERKTDTAAAREMADMLFSRREDKAQFASLFAATSWQRST